MEIDTILITVVAGAVCNVLLIVWLYNTWIIPTIVKRVRDELMTNIEKWIQETRDDLGDKIVISVDEMRQKLVNTISGYRGNRRKQIGLAADFLTANLEDPDDLETDAAQSVVTEAIATYGEKIVKAALKSIATKPEAATPAAGW